jgi:hypothetical protein
MIILVTTGRSENVHVIAVSKFWEDTLFGVAPEIRAKNIEEGPTVAKAEWYRSGIQGFRTHLKVAVQELQFLRS